jgi:hypothetical protein
MQTEHKPNIAVPQFEAALVKDLVQAVKDLRQDLKDGTTAITKASETHLLEASKHTRDGLITLGLTLAFCGLVYLIVAISRKVVP